MPGLVRHVRSEVSANDAMPSWVVLLIKLLFDVGCNICKKSKNLRLIKVSKNASTEPIKKCTFSKLVQADHQKVTIWQFLILREPNVTTTI